MSFRGKRQREEEGGTAGSNFPPIIIIIIMSEGRSVCVRVCSPIPVQMRSEKDLPVHIGSMFLEPNLWVCAPLRKA